MRGHVSKLLQIGVGPFEIGAGLPKLLLRPLPLDELPDLAPERRENLEQSLIGVFDVTTEKFDDPEDLVAQTNWETQSSAQARPDGKFCLYKIWVMGYVGNPCRFSGGPDPSRQALPRFKYGLAGGLDKLSDTVRGDLPGFQATGCVRGGVHHPNHAGLPAQ